MPATSSMIRTVPGEKVGPDGPADPLAGPAAGNGAGELLPDRATTRPTTTSTTAARTAIPTTRACRLRGGEAKVSGADDADSGSGGASTGECWTATPGPAGVIRSDQPAPVHQRTCPGAPSGSGYQPGGGVVPSGDLTAESLGPLPGSPAGQRTPAASSRQRCATASAPRCSIESSTRSLGEWIRSVGRPAPRKTSGAPSCSTRSASGPLPPSR